MEGNGSGACNYCHSTGTGQPGAIEPGIVDDPEFTGPFGPVAVYWNSENHHGTGLGIFNSSHSVSGVTTLMTRDQTRSAVVRDAMALNHCTTYA